MSKIWLAGLTAHVLVLLGAIYAAAHTETGQLVILYLIQVIYR